MSPEHVRRPAATDARGDVYSLGVVLYELLTGGPPFRGTTYAILQQVLQEEPRPPRQLDDRIPRDLETICLKAMAREPGHRYQTATEMAADLRRWLSGEPIRARPLGPVDRAWRWCRRPERIRDAGAFSLAVALLFGLWATVGLLTILTGLVPSERPLGSLLLVGLDGLAFVTFTVVGRGALAKRLAALWAGLVAGLLNLALVVALLFGAPFDGGGWLKDPVLRTGLLSLFALLATMIVAFYVMALAAYNANRTREG
jgi:hypothetical protein